MGKTLKYAFRITHIDNISQILRVGLVKKISPHRDERFVSIGDQRIIATRENLCVKGYRIGDYIPFYLGPRSPMLYVIQHGYNGVARINPEKIVYCVIRLDDIMNSNVACIFTDGHALNMLTSFYPKERLAQINDIIKYEDVYSTQWNSETDIDLKRRKEAELLVSDDLSAEFIRGYVVYNEKARQTLISFGINEAKIVVSPNYYF